MDALVDILSQYGYWGMLVAAFMAGSFFPFSSEAVMVAFQAAGLDPWTLIVYGTIGNVLGSMFNYYVGRLGRLEEIISIYPFSCYGSFPVGRLWQHSTRNSRRTCS